MSARTTSSILFHALHRAHQKTLQAELSAHGLDDLGSPPILFVIRDWEKKGRLASQKELADALHISPATMAVSLKSLERGGYVEKRGDPADQRCKRVAITEKGRRALEACSASFDQVDARMFAGFSAEERRQLGEYHQRMLHNLLGDADLEEFCGPCAKKKG